MLMSKDNNDEREGHTAPGTYLEEEEGPMNISTKFGSNKEVD
jgi:hypothetical protein